MDIMVNLTLDINSVELHYCIRKPTGTAYHSSIMGKVLTRRQIRSVDQYIIILGTK